jgi:hypothetical protein
MNNEQAQYLATVIAGDKPKATVINFDIDLDHTRDHRLQFKNKTFIKWTFKNISIDNSNPGALEFEDCEIGNITYNPSQSTSKLIFKKCRIGIVSIKTGQPVEQIFFGASTSIESLELHAPIRKLTISAVKITKAFSITGARKDTKISISNLECENEARISGLLNSIEITSSRDSAFTFKTIAIPKISLVELNKCDIRFEDANVPEGIVDIIKSNGSSFTFKDFGCRDVNLHSGSYGSLRFTGNGDFNLWTKMEGEPDLDIKELNLNEFTFIKDHRFELMNSIIDKLTMNKVYNKGAFRFANHITINKRFTLSQSTLNDTLFSNVDLDNDCILEILSTDITDVKFVNFQWNRLHKLNEDLSQSISPYKNITQFRFDLRESYRQLKANQIKTNNKIVSLEFQRHELRLHQAIIFQGLTYELFRKNKLEWGRFLGDYLVLWTHNAVSHFGQNVWRPLLLLFISHLILFNLLLVTIPELGLEFSSTPNWSDTWHGIDLFFYTILPTHTFNLTGYTTKAPVFIGGAIDFIMRIASGYFIFYFITASRKYHV